MPQVGLLIEHVYLSGTPLYLGTAALDAWAALRQKFDAEAVDWLAVELHPADADGGLLIFATKKFRCRPWPSMARAMDLRGTKAIRQVPDVAAGKMLGAAHAAGGVVSASENWASLIRFGD